jgi:CRP-like cAMP-binding protein
VIALPITATLIGRDHLGTPCALSFVLAGATVSVVGAAPNVAIVVVLVIAWGASMAVADATSLSLLHRLKDAAALGRTISVMEALKLSAEGAGALLAPVLVAVFGLRPALVVAGSLLPLLVAISWARIRGSDVLAQRRGKLVSLLHGLRVFRGSDMASLEQVASLVEPVSVEAGRDVVVEGEPGDLFYAIEAGEAEVLLGGYPVARLGPGQEFGDRALLRDAPRAATVRALTPMTLYALDRPSFLAAVTGVATEGVASGPELPYDFAARPLPELLADIALFHPVERPELERLAAAGALRRWSDGDTVVRERDLGREVYVVLTGRGRISIGGQASGELLPGDSFGEIAALHTGQRAATVTADGGLTTLVLPGDAVVTALEAAGWHRAIG